jgi:hypothetical protein
MTELTPRQFIDAVTRSLSETWQRMSEKYKNEALDQRTPSAEAPNRPATGAGGRNQKASRGRKGR